ncbi:MAG: hypothetical protein ABI780_06865 [Ardenticatenales bacterium]
MQKSFIAAVLVAATFAAGVAVSAFDAPDAQASRGTPSGTTPPVTSSASTLAGATGLLPDDAVKAARERLDRAARDMQPNGKLTPAALALVDQERADVLRWMDEFIAAHDLVATSPDVGGRDRIRGVRDGIAAMPPEQLHMLRLGMGDDPGFWQMPALVQSIVAPGSVPVPPFYVDEVASWREVPEGVTYSSRPSQYRIAAGMIGGPSQPSLPGDPGGMMPDVVRTPNATQSVPYPDRTPFPTREAITKTPDRGGCAGAFKLDNVCEGCPDSVPLGVVFAAKVAAIIARGLNDASGTSEQNVCAPPGVGFTVPKFYKYIFIGIAWGADQLVLALESANKVAASCRDGFVQGLTDEYLDETISSRVSQASFDAHANLEMQLAIERNLLRGADENIALFQLPAHLCGGLMPQADVEQHFRFCGKLELVRQVVLDAINANNSAGGTVDVNNARLELTAGDMHYMNSQWKSAYARYRNAYIRVVQQSSTP